MSRYFVDIAYNGTNYFGYQFQTKQVSVQETLEKALSVFLKLEIKTTGSSRTDAGVHALHNVCHFDIERELDVDQVIFKLNKILPHDIVCNDLYKVEDDKHARFTANHRKYVYKIHTKKDAFSANQSYFFKYGKLNINAINNAIKILMQYNEFDCFCKLHGDNKTTICDIMAADWKVLEDGKYEFHIQSNRFLRGMVRAIVGTLILVGREKLSLEAFKALIEDKDMSKADFSPPGHGLYLVEVAY
jgi:tRNA pseudouridine38-40 synthase